VCCCRQHTYANSEGLILFTPLPCSEIIMMCVGSLIFVLTSSPLSLFLTHVTYIAVHLPLRINTSVMTCTYAGHGGEVPLLLLNTTTAGTPVSYADDTGFESKPGDRLFYVTLSWSGQSLRTNCFIT
jgi:hypothetical protein